MTKVTKGGRASDEVKSKLDRNCLRMTATSLALEKYLMGKESMMRVAHTIVNTGDKKFGLIAQKAKHNKQPDQALDPLTFLRKLQLSLMEDQRYSRIDYLKLTRQCHELM